MGTKQEYFDFLRNIYFFRDLSDDAVTEIAAMCTEEEFGPDEVIFFENANAEKFYVVMSGQVEVWKDYQRDDADLLAVHGKGHLFGEMALVDDLPRSATVKARTHVRVLFLARNEFAQVLEKNPRVAISIVRSLSAMVRTSNESFVEDLRRRNEKLEEAYAELKAAQNELLRAERFSNLGKFSSMILHDIRNPISILKGYGEMISMHHTDAERVRKYAQNIVREAERINHFAGELLDYSRGEIRLNMNIASPDNLIENLRTYIGDSYASREITIESDVRYREPVILDEERMLRVLINLADNARKAMRRSGVLSILVERRGDALAFEISDNGEGMSDDVRERIFEPFYSSAKDGGTGLGMLVVKNIVEAHDGDLDVESTVGVGTKVTIRLPVRS